MGQQGIACVRARARLLDQPVASGNAHEVWRTRERTRVLRAKHDVPCFACAIRRACDYCAALLARAREGEITNRDHEGRVGNRACERRRGTRERSELLRSRASLRTRLALAWLRGFRRARLREGSRDRARDHRLHLILRECLWLAHKNLLPRTGAYAPRHAARAAGGTLHSAGSVAVRRRLPDRLQAVNRCCQGAWDVQANTRPPRRARGRAHTGDAGARVGVSRGVIPTLRTREPLIKPDSPRVREPDFCGGVPAEPLCVRAAGGYTQPPH